MMIKINLLPPEIKARQEQEHKKRLAVTAGGAVLAVCLLIYGIVFAMTIQVNAGASRYRGERLALEDQFRGYEVYAKMVADLAKAGSILQEAMGSPPDWAGTLQDIGLDIPVNVWLTDITAKKSDASPGAPTSVIPSIPGNTQGTGAAPQAETTGSQNGPGPANPASTTAPPAKSDQELILRGWAYDHTSVVNWLEDIRGIEGLTDVNCQFSSEESHQGKSLIKFEIKARLKPGAGNVAQTGKAGE